MMKMTDYNSILGLAGSLSKNFNYKLTNSVLDLNEGRQPRHSPLFSLKNAEQKI